MLHRLRRAFQARRAPDAATPRVSVVITTYNRARSLAAALDGLARQTFENFEVIVVNGPSTDDTESVLERYAAKIRIGRCAERKVGAPRNIGVELAAGDIIAFIDDDAVARASWLETLVSGYRDRSVGAVGGFVFDINNGVMQWEMCTCRRSGEVSVDTPPPYRRYHGRQADPFLFFPACNMSARRSCIEAVGGFSPLYRSCYDDAEFISRVHEAGFGVVTLGAALVDHYVQPNAMRDRQRVIRDPYNLVHDTSVFIIQNRIPRRSFDDACATARRNAEVWRNAGRTRLSEGAFTAPEYERYSQRIDAGLRDGTAAAAAPRVMHRFPPPAPDMFRRFTS